MSARPEREQRPANLTPKTLALAALFGFVYWLLRRYCLSLPVAASTISYVWLPDGLALGALLCTRVREWPPFLLVMFVIGIVDSGRPFGAALTAIALNMLEPALVAFLLQHLLGTPPRIDSVKGISALFLCTIPLMAGATLLSSGIDWFVQEGQYWKIWSVWFVSDTLGMLLVAPLVVAWFGGAGGMPPAGRGRAVEAALAFGGLVMATHAVYGLDGRFGAGLAIAAGTVPFLLWAALRFGMRGATLALAIFAMQSFWYTANGLGHFARNFTDPFASVVALQIYLLVVTLSVLLPAALIAERGRAYLESIDWRRRYESVLAASESLMYEVGAHSRTLHWAGDVRKVLGIAPEKVGTVPEWIERVHPDDRHLLEGIRLRLATGELASVTREYRLRRDDGRYAYIDATAYGIAIADARPGVPEDIHVVGFIRDVSERRRAEDENRLLEERLKQAQKMEAIGRFAGGIAHDFNNILGAVIGYGELARDKVSAGSDLHRYLDTIHAAGERGKALVAQILTFSRAKSAEKRPVHVAELVEEVVTQVRASLFEGIAIDLVNECPGAVVLGEATQLHQLVMNLCTNAVQAMRAGGKATVSVRTVRIETARAAYLGTLQPAKYVAIEVRDEGLGMNEATVARIFEPFFTTKPTGSGTGLGLSLVQSIALEHDGALDIETAPGRGTRIAVYLPEVDGDWQKPAEPERPLARGNGETILVIDDELAMAQLAQEILAELGYEPVAYTSSLEALDAYERDPARFDAILSDEVMPQLTGTQLAARVRQANPSVPILIVSGYGGPGFDIRAIDAGVDRLLHKPYQKRELADALASALRARQ